ncbi:hypothetical protein TNCV_934481 [Trichonephila clavipes]|nr:hypothetical protein TNCV_934481 [Trichonephila clavipes]
MGTINQRRTWYYKSRLVGGNRDNSSHQEDDEPDEGKSHTCCPKTSIDKIYCSPSVSPFRVAAGSTGNCASEFEVLTYSGESSSPKRFRVASEPPRRYFIFKLNEKHLQKSGEVRPTKILENQGKNTA